MSLTVRARGDVMPPFLKDDLCRGEAFVFLDILPVALKVEDQGKVVFPKTVIEITIVTDLLEAFRKHVEQETLHKLQRSDGKCPGLPAIFAACREDHFILFHGNDPGVRDRHFISIASQVLDGIAVSVKRFLDFGDPFTLVQPVPESSPFIMIAQTGCRSGKDQTMLAISVVKHGKELSPEFCCEDAFRNKKGVPVKCFKLPVCRKPAAGDHGVDMRMEQKLL